MASRRQENRSFIVDGNQHSRQSPSVQNYDLLESLLAGNMASCINATELENCTCYSDSDRQLLSFFSFWVEGILTTVVGILGLVGNTVVSFIISNREMRNSFNLLLVSLACFDSTYVSTSTYLFSK